MRKISPNKKIHQKALAMMLALYMLILQFPAELAAAENERASETKTSEYQIQLNGSSTKLPAAGSFSGALQVPYGDLLELTLDGFTGQTEPSYLYLNGNQEITGETQWEFWSESQQPKEPGSYFIGYVVTEDGAEIENADDSNGFTIVKAQLAAARKLSWENGSTATWGKVTETESGSKLDEGAVGSYQITLYKDGTKVETVEEPGTTTNHDFTATMLKEGEGAYTFTVKALTANDETIRSHYESSEDSKASANTMAVELTLAQDAGIQRVSLVQEQQLVSSALLIAGNSSYSRVTVSAEAAEGRSFDAWKTDTQLKGIQITAVEGSASSGSNSIIQVMSTYEGDSQVVVKACSKDIAAPVIDSYRAGTRQEGKYGMLLGTASDPGSGIAAFAFSTEEAVEDLKEDDWQKAPEAEEATGRVSCQMQVEAAGKYFFYVKDGEGNVSVSGETIPATQVIYEHYYNGTASEEYSQFLVGSEDLTLAEPERPGYRFEGWYESEDAQEPITAIAGTQHQDAPIPLYGKWSRLDVEFTKQPEDLKAFTYDGKEHSLTVGVSNYGDVTYQWYKDGQMIPGATDATYAVKDVTDSGTYYAQVSVAIDGETQTVSSRLAQVEIQPAPLTVVAGDTQITYGMEAPDSYAYQYQGFVNQETAQDAGVTEGTVTCIYDPASQDPDVKKVGTYTIVADGFSAANYTIDYESGILTVMPKDVEADDSGVTASLEQTSYAYTGDPEGIQPVVTVLDGETKVDQANYTLTYEHNVEAGPARAILTFKGNYTGTKTLEFTITRGSFTAQVELDQTSWTYGETAGQVSLDTNPGSGEVTYYYQELLPDDKLSDPVTSQPVDAGTYQVYGVIEATDNYESVTTEAVKFLIKKREITLTAASREWTFNGSSHACDEYTMEGSFAGTDGFHQVTVTGSIFHAGSVENIVSYTLSSATKERNYQIQCVPGTLTVTPKELPAPGDLQGSKADPGTAEWVAVSRSDLAISYNVSLYRIDERAEDPEDNLVETITTTATSYDFLDSIKADCRGQRTAGGYYFRVQAVPSGGENQGNYTASAYSEKSSDLYTIMLIISKDPGIQATKIVTNTGDKPSSEDSNLAYLLQGEKATITAEAAEGYALGETVWSASQDPPFTLGDVTKETITLQVSDKLTEPCLATLYAHSKDDKPIIGNFDGEVDAHDPHKVHLTLDAADTEGIAAWAITQSEQAPAEDSSQWQEPTGENKNAQAIQESITVDSPATYYAYVKDIGGNVVSSGAFASVNPSVSIFEVTFAGGTGGEGSMDPILKVQNRDLILPANGFQRSGYSFQNWKGDSGVYSDQGKYGANKTETLTAQWTNRQCAYQVEYYYMKTDGSYGDTPDSNKSFSAAYGSIVTSADDEIALSLPGMSLDKGDDRSSQITLTQDGQTLKVYYQRAKRTITYTYTRPGETQAVTDTKTYYYGQVVEDYPIPEVTGYDFVGWVYGESGKLPETMPNENIKATGTFVSQTTEYVIHYYTQNLEDDGTVSDTYTLVEELTQRKNSKQGETITARVSDAETIQGFTPKGILITNGTTGGAEPEESALTTEASGTVSAAEGETLNINYYYSRNDYSLTLNVWKGNRAGTPIYSHTWDKIPYGTAMDEAAIAKYTGYQQEEWGAGENLEGYVLADYIGSDWSTGSVPAVMPAANISVSRDYIRPVDSPYQVEVYYETAEPGQYAREASLTYYANSGETVTVGKGEESTIQISDFQRLLSNFSQYTFSDKNTGNVLTGRVADVTTGEESLCLKVYFDRNTVTTKIRYYYNDGNDDGSSANTLIGTLTKEDKWGQSYTGQPLALFAGTGIPEDWTQDGVYTSEKETIGETQAEDYNFKANEYLVSYVGRYDMNGADHRTSKYFRTAQELAAEEEMPATFTLGQNSETNYINVVYTKVDRQQHYFLDVVYDPSGLKKASAAEKVDHQLTVELTEGEYAGVYKVRAANKADIFQSTYVPATGDYTQYPGAAGIDGTYTYSGELQEGYQAVTITTDRGNTTGYIDTRETGEDRYVYFIDGAEGKEPNQFYYGNWVSYHFLDNGGNPGQAGYDSVKSYLDQYKLDHGSSGSADYDAGVETAYPYDNGFGALLYGQGTYRFTFAYKDPYTVTHTLSGNSCVGHTCAAGTTVDPEALAEGEDFQEKEGYRIVWYRDSNFTTKAEAFTITGDTILYGRYEREILTYDEYAYYRLPEAIKLDGLDVFYLTEKNLDDVVNSGLGEITQETTEAESVSYIDGNGKTVEQSVPVSRYYYNGYLVMVKKTLPCLTFSEVNLEWSDYLLDGFQYDSSHTGNVLHGYCQTAGISMGAYFVREKYTLTLTPKDSKVENSETQTLSYGQRVRLEAPEKNGYAFAGWKWQRWDDTANDGEGGWIPWTEGAPEAAEDGSVSFAMPQFNVRAEGQWDPAEFIKTATHYFQQTTQIYGKEALAKLKAGNITKKDGTISYNGKTSSGILYYDADNQLVGASVTLDASALPQLESYTAYYGVSHSKEIEGGIQVDVADLLAIETVIKAKSEEPLEIGNYEIPVTGTSYFMFQYGFTVYQDETQVQTLGRNDQIHCSYDMTLDYYYTRKNDCSVEADAKATDQGETGVTITGAGVYYYGEDVDLKASLSEGYTFKGWYKAEDVLADYDAESSAGLEEYQLKEGWEKEDPVTSGQICQVRTRLENRYVAVVEPKPAAETEVSLSGQQQYGYGYASSPANGLTAAVEIGENPGNTTYISGYQWYEIINGEEVPIQGANSTTYVFPTGNGVGSYQYCCYATVARRDNGRSNTVKSQPISVSVVSADMTAEAVNFDGTYDGTGHSIDVKVTLPDGSSADTSTYQIYYSTEEALNETNYRDKGQEQLPELVDVATNEDGSVVLDQDGQPVGYTVYFYVDNTDGNYRDTAGSGKVVIRPATLTLKSGGQAFSKTYDGTKEITGSVSVEGSEKDQLSSGVGQYYTIRGLMERDEDQGYRIDFDGTFDDPHVETGSKITLSRLSLVDGSGKTDGNYIFASDYTASIPGSITPHPLQVCWSEDTSFVYDGTQHVVSVVLQEDGTVAEQEGVGLTLSGSQINVGNYTARIEVAEQQDPEGNPLYDTADYSIAQDQTARDFQITKRPVHLSPVSQTVEYDGTVHYLSRFTIDQAGQGQSGEEQPGGEQSGSEQAEEGVLSGHTWAADTDQGGKNAGTYTVTAVDLHLYSGNRDVTDNYQIFYGTAELIIDPKPVTLSGIQVSEKKYDGNKKGTVDLTEAVFHGKVDGDELSLSGLTARFEDPHAGADKPVTLSYEHAELTGADQKNYVIAIEDPDNQTSAKASITKRDLVITCLDANTVYGEEDANFQADMEGFVGTDTRAVLDGEIQYRIKETSDDAAKPYTATTEAGSYLIEMDLSQLSSQDYRLVPANQTESPARLTVAKRPVTVHAKEDAAVTKVYDGTKSVGKDAEAIEEVLEGTYGPDDVDGTPISGVVNGDKITIVYTATYDDQNATDSTTDPEEPTGAQKILMQAVSLDKTNTVNDNYTLINDSFAIPATITKHPLWIAAVDETVTYGDETPEYQASYSDDEAGSGNGFVAGESIRDLEGTLSFACAYDPDAPETRGVKEDGYLIQPSGCTSGNYEINYQPGCLRVNPAEITVTAGQKTMTCGETAPEYTWSYSGFMYDDKEDMITGTPQLTCVDASGQPIGKQTTAGRYTIQVDTESLSADNYTFKPVTGTLEVKTSKTLKISGITVAGKTYDGTVEVASEKISLKDVNFQGLLDGDTASAEDITVTAEYGNKNAGSNKTVTLNITLSEALAGRYDLSEDTQVTATADIDKKDLYLTARPTTIYYGDPEPGYEAVYHDDPEGRGSGFVNGETDAVLEGSLSWTEDYDSNDPIGDYLVTPKGYSSDNYQIHYSPGTLSVLPAQLKTPEGSWSRETAGTLTWNKIAGIGNVDVKEYQVMLYKAPDKGEESTSSEPERIETKTVQATQDDSFSCSFLSEIRTKGAGEYYAVITAVAKEENNRIQQDGGEDKFNVLDSKPGTTGSIYAADVTVQYGTNDITEAGRAEDGTIAIGSSGKAHYVVVAGEKEISLTAGLNSSKYTGYEIDAWNSSDPELSISNSNQEEDALSAEAELAYGWNTNTKITITLTLKARKATLKASISADPDKAKYGYAAEDPDNPAPKLTAKADVDSDNVDTEGYTYGYQWYLKKGAAGANTLIEGATDAQYTVPAGYSAANNYRYSCKVTATRDDNMQSTTVTTNTVTVVIERASFTAEVDLDGWTYGETRSTPEVTRNPENGQVTYLYSTSSSDQAVWTTTVPKDAGNYYVKADIATTENYLGLTTAPASFEIKKAVLAAPKNLTMGPSAETAPYGLISWDSVSGPAENNGIKGNSDSKIQVSYQVRLYRADSKDVEAEDTDGWTEVTEAATVTEDTRCDLSQYMTQQGRYKYTVQALAQCVGNDGAVRETINCSDSSLTVGTLTIDGQITETHHSFSKTYDGTPLTLTVTLGEREENVEYQWLFDGKLIPEADQKTYELTYVEQSGRYTCNIYLNGSKTPQYSTNHQVTIDPRKITITAQGKDKTYDGTPLTNQYYTLALTPNGRGLKGTALATDGMLSDDSPDDGVLGDGDTLSCKMESSITNAGSKDNTITQIQITHGTGESAKIVYQETLAEGDTLQNYTVTKVSEKLTVNPRPLAITGPSSTKTYDGTPLTDQELSHCILSKTAGTDGTPVTESGLASGDVLAEAEISGSRITKGSSENTIGKNSVVIRNGSGEGAQNVTDSYKITLIPGTLTVTRRPITIGAGDEQGKESHTYTGETFTPFSYTISTTLGQGLASGDSVSQIQITGSQTVVGHTDTAIQVLTLCNSKGSDVTDSYEITTKDGILEVTPAQGSLSLISSAQDMGKTYDRQAVTDPQYKQVGDGIVSFAYEKQDGNRWISLAEGEKPVSAGTYRVQGIAEAGDNYTGASSDWLEFVISPRAITLQAGDKESVHGYPMQSLSVRVAEGSICAGDEDALAIDAQTDAVSNSSVGRYPIWPTYTANGNYTVTTINGTYTISSATFTCQLTGYRDVYDGQLHSFTITPDLPDGVSSTVYCSDQEALNETNYQEKGVQDKAKFRYKDVGNYTVYVYVTAENRKPYMGSVEIQISKRQPEITVEDLTVTYDGTVHSIIAEVDGDGGLEYQNDQHVDAGSYLVTIKTSDTHNCYAAEATATLEILKRPLTLTAASSQKIYDGKPLTDSSYQISGDGLARGDFLHQVIVTGSQTEIGSSVNQIGDAILYNGEGEDVTENYRITYQEGKLTVKAMVAVNSYRNEKRRPPASRFSGPGISGPVQSDFHDFGGEQGESLEHANGDSRGHLVLFNLLAALLLLIAAGVGLLRKRSHRMLSTAVALGGLILLLLTEELGTPVIFDLWSLAFAVLLLIMLLITRQKKKDDEEDPSSEEA